MLTKKELVEILRSRNIRLRKQFGQNFLVNPAVCRKLVELCEIKKEDSVVEIGPGLGALTQFLAVSAKEVTAVELDRQVFDALKDILVLERNIKLLCEDILALDWKEYKGSIVVGAIPYNITSPILAALCENSSGIPRAYLGVQIELARRICSAPSTKEYGRLGILVQYHFKPKLLYKIPREVFFPQPTIDSAWISLLPLPKRPLDERLKNLFFDLVKASFAHRRKTLQNCLSGLEKPALSKEESQEILRLCKFNPNVRAEELSVEDFVLLTQSIWKHAQGKVS